MHGVRRCLLLSLFLLTIVPLASAEVLPGEPAPRSVITGQLTTTDGIPTCRVDVAAYRVGSTIPVATTNTGSDGQFRLDLPSDTWTLRFSSPYTDDLTLPPTTFSGDTPLAGLTLDYAFDDTLSGELTGDLPQGFFYVHDDLFVPYDETFVIPTGTTLWLHPQVDILVEGTFEAGLTGPDDQLVVMETVPWRPERWDGFDGGGSDEYPAQGAIHLENTHVIHAYQVLDITANFYVGGQISTATNCVFQDISGFVAHVENNTSLILTECEIQDVSYPTESNTQILADYYGHITITDCLVQNVTGNAVAAVYGYGTALVQGTTFRQISDRAYAGSSDVSDCVFEEVGIGISALRQVISDCVFRDAGTGVYLDTDYQGGSTEILDCRFDNCDLAVHTEQATTLVMEDCQIIGGGRGVTGWDGNLTLSRTVIAGLRAPDGYDSGVAVYLDECDALIDHCSIVDNRTLDTGNTEGVGIAAYHGSRLNLTNSLIAGNVADSGSQLHMEWIIPDQQVIRYNLFWGPDGQALDDWISIDDDVLGMLLGYNGNGSRIDGYHNVFAAQQFQPDSRWDTSPRPGSPVIDAGDPNSPLDPDGTVADIGAYYFDQQTDVATHSTGEPLRNDGSVVPSVWSVSAPSPNPFNAATTLTVNLPQPCVLSVVVHDLLGRQVAVLASGLHPAGRHRLSWEPASAASGMYVVRAEIPGAAPITRKLVLVR